MTIEIESQILAIKEIVDNAMHVMIDEDELFSFAKEFKENINKTKNYKKIEIDKIIQTLLNLNILKTDNESARNELEASAKLVVHLIKEENNCETDKILSYLN
ncbi:MAG: hypothetical protein HRU03_07040 [Nanoarchaeales archaeon]|nr:hypothetical protein [Nanoarchaeales archaeon]